MTVVWLMLVAAIVAGAGYLVLVGWRGTGIARLEPAVPDPARDRDEALARFSAVRELDTPEYAPAGASILLEPDAANSVPATMVFFHGFTNAPSQFHAVGEELRRRGYRVLVTRQPRHGLADVMTRELERLEAAELIEHVGRTLDIAAGFPGPTYVLGMSGGGVQAAWAAATRADVSRAVVVSPASAPTGTPIWAVRLSVRYRSRLPGVYIWWDPRKKRNRVQSQWEYPGFPLPGIIPILHMSVELGDRRVTTDSAAERPVAPDHRLERVALISNPNDHAVNPRASRWMVRGAFAGHADDLEELVVARELHWGHDFIDPAAQHPGTPEQVADVLLAAFGITDDATAGGLLARGEVLGA